MPRIRVVSVLVAMLLVTLVGTPRLASANSNFKTVSIPPNCNNCTRTAYPEVVWIDGTRIVVYTQVWWGSVGHSSFYVDRVQYKVYVLTAGRTIYLPSGVVYGGSGPSFERLQFDNGNNWCQSPYPSHLCGTMTINVKSWYSGGATRFDGSPSTFIHSRFAFTDGVDESSWYTNEAVFYIDTPGDHWDVHSDGESDLMLVTNAAAGTNFNVVRSTGSDFVAPAVWQSTSWGFSGIKAVTGDVDYDGKADLVTLNNNGAGGTSMHAFLSTAGDFEAPNTWHSRTWGWNGIKPLMGDVNGDGRADLVTLNNDATGTSVNAFLSTGYSFTTPAIWRSTTWGWSGIKPLMGDVNGDKKADLVTLNNNGAAGTSMHVFLSTGSGFAAPVTWRNTTWGWGGIKQVMGDVNGDGKADLVTLNNNGAAGTSMHAFLSTGSAFAAPVMWRNTTWSWSAIKPLIAKVTTDTKADLVTVNNAGSNSTQMWTLASTGTGFAAPALWETKAWIWNGVLVPS